MARINAMNHLKQYSPEFLYAILMHQVATCTAAAFFGDHYSEADFYTLFNASLMGQEISQ